MSLYETISIGTNQNESPEAQSLTRFLAALFDQAKGAVDKRQREWSQDWDFYLGKQWDDNIQKKRPYAVTANIIRPNIEDQVSFLTAGAVAIGAQPREYDDNEYARRVETLVGYQWDGIGMDLKSMDLARTSLVLGTAFAKPYWDPSKLGGMGDVGVHIIDPAFVLPAPGATDIEDAAFVIHAQPYPLFEIRAMWPEKGWMVRPDEVLTKRFGIKGKGEAPGGGTSTTINTPAHEPGEGTGNEARAYGMAWVFECWVRDDSASEQVVPDPMTGQLVSQLVHDYPRGRVITASDGWILADHPNQYSHGRFPFRKLTLNPIPGEFYGFSEVEANVSAQKDYNDLRTDAREYRKLMGNGWIFVPQGSITDYTRLRAKTGAIIPYIPIDGKGPERQAPNAFPPGFLDWMIQGRQEVEYDMGIFAANRGQAPGGGIRSGRAIMALQEWGANRMSMKRRVLESTLSGIAQDIFQLVRQYWTYPRALRVTGEGGIRRSILVGGPAVDSALMQMFSAEKQMDTMTLAYDCDITVRPKSTMQRDQDRDYMVAREMAISGIMTPERWIEIGDLPGWEQDVEELRKRQMQQQQMQMMQMAQQQAQQQQVQAELGRLDADEKKQVMFGIEPDRPEPKKPKAKAK